MKTPKIYSLVFFVIAFISVHINAQENQDRRPSREKWNNVSMQGTVKAINADTRELTLMDTNGNLATVTAGEEVKRFDEIAVNDVLKFDYYTYMKAEFREPTAEEIAEPLVVIAEGGKAPEGVDPAAAVGAVVKAVVSIEVLNRPNMTATVKGPRGNYVTIQMEDEALIKELKIGEVLILIYAEAVAVSLEKVGTTTE
jgi:Cu/Ag efflux protein CusF